MAWFGSLRGRAFLLDPPNDVGPGFFQSERSHEQTDVAAWHQFLSDLVLRGGELLLRLKHLRLGGDIVVLASHQEGWTGDVMQANRLAQRHKLAFAELVVLE